MPMNREFWRGREDFERDDDRDRFERDRIEREWRGGTEGGRWREERPLGRGLMGRGMYGDRMYGGGMYGYDWGGQRDLRERGLGERARRFFGRVGEEIREAFGRPSRHYTRSDERIREDVYERLMDQDFIDADDVEVKVKDCEVTLTGTVPSRGDKRMCEDLAESCLGVKDVHNQLRVVHNGGATVTTPTEKTKPRA